MDLTLVTCLQMPEPDPDEELLLGALADAGIEARMAAWDDPTIDWNATRLTVIRSTWNYTDDRDGFLAWARRVSSGRTSLRNSLAAIGPNTHKSYLATLERAEVPVVPTRWFMRGGRAADVDAIHTLPWERIVAKPAIGAGSRGVAAFDLTDEADLERASQHVQALQATTDVLVQPQLASIVEEGEHDVVWIDGEVTHVVRKRQRLADDHEHVDIAREATDDERALALRTLRTVPAFNARDLLYARVDMARDELGDLRVIELELVEPSLFLAQHPPALERFVSALQRDCGLDGR